MEVDGAAADSVAADDGHERLVVAGEQGSEQQDRDAVEPGELSGTLASGLSTGSIEMRSPSISTPTPSEVRMSAVIPTSPTSGALVIVLGAVPSMAATMCLVTAFFDPLTSTSPTSGPLGWMCQAAARGSFIGRRVTAGDGPETHHLWPLPGPGLVVAGPPGAYLGRDANVERPNVTFDRPTWVSSGLIAGRAAPTAVAPARSAGGSRNGDEAPGGGPRPGHAR